MSKPIQFVYLASVLLLAMAVSAAEISNLHIQVRKNILNDYLLKGDLKALFKAYHFAYSKSYDYNTEEGIAKYKTFRANIKKMIQHNKSDATWKMGINHLTDMTAEEVRSSYYLKYFTPKEVSRQLRSVSLDDFNDDEETRISGEINKPGERSNIDWTPKMRPVKSQGFCGSCWAFATIETIEGNRAAKDGKELEFNLSPQQLIDCDGGNYGCNGGWYTSAIKYLETYGTVKDDDYPYKAQKESCVDKDKAKTPVKPIGYKYTYSPDLNFESLKTGPVAAAIDANEDFYAYESGVWNGVCSNGVNHAMVIVGYSVEKGAWRLQNSWGSDWGEKGFVWVKDQGNANNYSCYVGRYGYRPTL